MARELGVAGKPCVLTFPDSSPITGAMLVPRAGIANSPTSQRSAEKLSQTNEK